MRKIILMGLGMLWASSLAWGNGGGYARGGATGGDVQGFEPVATEHIRILDEQLTADLGPTEADVTVRYLMRNETNKRVKVKFGFPVDESSDDEFVDGQGTKQPPPKEPKHCQGYQLSAAGQVVKAKWQAEPKQPANGPADARFKGLSGWFVSELTFAAGEEKPVMIRFRSGYPLSGFQVSGQGTMSSSNFTYRLSTAACWAGTIGKGRIELKPTAGVDPTEVKVLKPVNRFRKEGNAWVWNFENLEPSLADDLTVEVVPSVESMHGGGRLCHGRNNQWYYLSTDYAIKASSVHAPEERFTYEPENVKDGYPGSCWVEGASGPGTGEWLELRPNEPKALSGLQMWPGFHKSPELFKANARPKRIKVTLNGEHSFVADIPDLMDNCRIPLRGYDKPVKVIKLAFEDVWPGARFEDLCVTWIGLEVKLAKKPKQDPVR
jgi:hypothetical protein